MYHLGQLVKEWRMLNRSMKKSEMEGVSSAGSAAAATAELEWRFGKRDQDAFEPGIEGTDFQTLAKRLMNMFQQPPPSTNSKLSPNDVKQPLAVAAAGGGKNEKEMDDKAGGSPVSLLGRIVKVQEWHLEDVQYEGGFRTRQAKLVSSLPPSNPTGGANVSNPTGGGDVVGVGGSVSECIEKRRVAWSNLMVLQRKYDGRFSLKCERPVPSSTVANLVPDHRRMQTRRSFWIDNYLRIDLSIVRQQQFSRLSSADQQNPTVTYEVEMELLPEGAQTISDQQLVAHLWNWILEILDPFGKINGSESIDGNLLVLRLFDKIPNNTANLPNPSNPAIPNASPAPLLTSPQRAICTDVLLVPTHRNICRNHKTS